MPSSQPSLLRSLGPCETLTWPAMPALPNWRTRSQITNEPIDQPTSTAPSSSERVEQVLHVLRVLRDGVAALARGRLAVPAQVDVDDAEALGERPRVVLEEAARHAHAVQQDDRPALAGVVVGQARAVGKLVEAGHGPRLCQPLPTAMTPTASATIAIPTTWRVRRRSPKKTTATIAPTVPNWAARTPATAAGPWSAASTNAK